MYKTNRVFFLMLVLLRRTSFLDTFQVLYFNHQLHVTIIGPCLGSCTSLCMSSWVLNLPFLVDFTRKDSTSFQVRAVPKSWPKYTTGWLNQNLLVKLQSFQGFVDAIGGLKILQKTLIKKIKISSFEDKLELRFSFDVFLSRFELRPPI